MNIVLISNLHVVDVSSLITMSVPNLRLSSALVTSATFRGRHYIHDINYKCLPPPILILLDCERKDDDSSR